MIAKYGSVVVCPACAQDMYEAKARGVRACRCENARRNIEFTIDTSSHGSKYVPHLHVRCERCHFEWLEEVHDLAKFQELL